MNISHEDSGNKMADYVSACKKKASQAAKKSAIPDQRNANKSSEGYQNTYHLNEASSKLIIDSIKCSADSFFLEYHVDLHHGIRKLRIEKKLEHLKVNEVNDDKAPSDSAVVDLEKRLEKLVFNDNSHVITEENTKARLKFQNITEDKFSEVLNSLTYLDLNYVHTYSEGAELKNCIASSATSEPN